MTVRFLTPARDEFTATVSWYDEREPGLGARFSSAVQATVRRIRADPKSYESLSNSFYRCRVSNCPYAVVYSIDADAF